MPHQMGKLLVPAIFILADHKGHLQKATQF
jgi:hypothetical protein